MSDENIYDGIAEACGNGWRGRKTTPFNLADLQTVFDSTIEEGARQHERAMEWGKAMREDPEYRRRWNTMVEVIGYEPRAGTYAIISKRQEYEIERRLAEGESRG